MEVRHLQKCNLSNYIRILYHIVNTNFFQFFFNKWFDFIIDTVHYSNL